MGAVVVVPEGEIDFDWLRIWQRVAEASDEVSSQCCLTPLTFIPTSDAAIVSTIAEIGRFRTDLIALVDGDDAGDMYVRSLLMAQARPHKIIQFGKDAAIECLSAWILEPALRRPGSLLSGLFTKERTLRSLQNELLQRKDDKQFREDIAWEALETPECALRAGQFLEDVSLIATDKKPQNAAWKETQSGVATTVYSAHHIIRKHS